MDVGSFAIPVPKEKFDEARSLLAELNRTHLNELAARARVVGYHREVMALHSDGFLTVHLQFNDATSKATLQDRLRAYPKNDFTRWWSPRFDSIGPIKGYGEELFTWIDDQLSPSEYGEKGSR